MRWLDSSAFTGELAPSFIDAARENNVEGLAVQLYGGSPGGTGLNPSRFQQLDLARAAGLRIAGYVWPPFSVTYALAQTHDYPFEFVALDIEAGAGMTRSDVDSIRRRGFMPVKYASFRTWRDIMGGTAEFADVDTWLAYYLQQGWQTWESVAWLGLPDGSRTMMVQVQGTTTLLDDQFDLNVADRTWFAVQQEVETMRLVQASDSGRVLVLGESGKRWIDDTEERDAYFAAGYAPEVRVITEAQADAIPDAPNAKDIADIKAAIVALTGSGAHTH